MPAIIHRTVVGPKKLTIAANASDSDEIDVSGGDHAMVYVPSNWAGADITFLAAPLSNAYSIERSVDTPGTPATQPEPTYSLVQDENGDVLRIKGIRPGNWHLFPISALRMKFLRLRSTLVGSAVGQATVQPEDVVLILLIKS